MDALSWGTEGIIDPYIAIHVYFGVACFHVLFIVIFWFAYCEGGKLMQIAVPGDTLYWWMYMSALISFVVAWGPVMLLYPLTYVEDLDAKFAYLIAVMASIDGPMLGNVFPIFLACWIYF